MITEREFWKGRDVQYASDLTPEIQANAKETLRRVNELLKLFYAARPASCQDRGCNSGWRPPRVNARTRNAALKSHHMTGKACDVGDDDSELGSWLMTTEGQAALVKIGLWIEHPSATPRWSHFQTVPPRSGRRVFYP